MRTSSRSRSSAGSTDLTPVEAVVSRTRVRTSITHPFHRGAGGRTGPLAKRAFRDTRRRAKPCCDNSRVAGAPAQPQPTDGDAASGRVTVRYWAAARAAAGRAEDLVAG